MDNSRSARLNIPVSHFMDMLSWDQGIVGRLLGMSVEIACRNGIQLEDDYNGIYLGEISKKGGKVDWNSRTVFFCEDDIHKTLSEMRRSFPLPIPARDITWVKDRKASGFNVGNEANLIFDWDKWEARLPERNDLMELCRWVEGEPDIGSVFPPVTLKDIDQMIEPIYNYALLAKHCSKTIMHEQPTSPMHVRYLGKMARAVERKTGFYQPILEFEYVNPPFRIGYRAVETMMARIDTGECDMMGIGSMAISGMSAPVTVAGTAVTAVAEILAALTLLRILRPGRGIRANVCTGNLDMRTGRVSYGNMHTHLQNIAGWEIITRGIGADSPLLTWYRDANEPGMQALYEFGVSQSFFSSIYMSCTPEIGGLCCGSIFSPEQAVMDMEAMKEFNELSAGFDFDDETVGVEHILEAGHRQSVFMTSDHTLKYMRDNVPAGRFFLRGLPAAADHNKNRDQTAELMGNAADAVKNAIKKGSGKGPDPDLGSELYEYVKEAALELGIECPEMI
jgi:trimethylamine:corrinoid methyltransferase-like protein